MLAAGWSILSVAHAQAASTFTPREEFAEEFPAGRGRDETFYSCTACHGFKLVAAQGLTREQWDESLAIMVKRHGMPELAAKDRELILDYLEASFPPRAATTRGARPNPFLKQ